MPLKSNWAISPFPTTASRETTKSPVLIAISPAQAFPTLTSHSLGVDDLISGRQAPTVLNAAFTPLLFWDGRAKSLEEQTLGTIQNPIDMAEMLDHFVLKLRNIKGYRRQFLNLFGTEVNPQGIAKAIAAFARTPNSTNPAFDQYSLGNKQAMNQAIIRGMTLFKAEFERVCEGISEKRCQTLRFS
jgi:cytochrome c peroxidase